MTDRVSDLITSRDIQKGRAKVSVRASTDGKRAPNEHILEITDQLLQVFLLPSLLTRSHVAQKLKAGDDLEFLPPGKIGAGFNLHY